MTDFRMLFMNGTTHSIRSISSSVILLLAISAHAATVWNGPMISFTKSNYANPLLAENQDRLTTNVWITRGSAQGYSPRGRISEITVPSTSTRPRARVIRN